MATTNGTPANPYESILNVKDVSREQVLAARRRLRLIETEFRVKRLERVTKLLETVTAPDYWINVLGDRVNSFRNDPNLAGFTNISDRQHGNNYPIFQNEQELGIIRMQSRILCNTNSYAIGLMEGLLSYVLGNGCTYRAVSKQMEDATAPELLGAINEIIDQHLKYNQWFGGEQPGLEEELVWRSCEDGEFFLIHYPGAEGRIDLRVAEPEQVTMPAAAKLYEWSYGIQTPVDDVSQALAYNFRWDYPQLEDEVLDADRVFHLRRNVRRNVKRGLPDFSFDALDAMYVAGKLRRNMSLGAAIQACYAGVRQHENATKSEVEGMQDLLTDFTRTNPVSERTENYQKHEPGIHDVPKGQEWVNPPTAQNAAAHVEILQACLRGAGVRWNAPEWLHSGLHDTSSFASSLTAESPFLRTVRRRQRNYTTLFGESCWKAVEARIRYLGGSLLVRRAVRDDAGRPTGRYGEERYTWEQIQRLVKLQVEAPEAEQVDKAADAQRRQIEKLNDVLSVQTWQQQVGLDPEREMINKLAYLEATGGQSLALPVPRDKPGAPQDVQMPEPEEADAEEPTETGSAILDNAKGSDAATALRSTVGGSQQIAALQTAYYGGGLTREAAMANAMIVFGFDQGTAERLFPVKPPGALPAPQPKKPSVKPAAAPVAESVALDECGGEGGEPGPCPDSSKGEGGKADKGAGDAASLKPDATHQDVADFQDKHYGEWRKLLPRDVRNSINSYAGNAYGSVNGLLRNPNEPMLQMQKGSAAQHTANLDQAFEKAPGLAAPITVQRGVFGSLAETVKGLKPGDSIQDKGFVSTTAAKDVAAEFTKGNGVVIQMDLPAGTKALPMTQFSNKEEGEFLLPRGSSFQVVSNDGKTVRVSLVQGGGKGPAAEPPPAGEKGDKFRWGEADVTITRGARECGGEGGEPGPCPSGQAAASQVSDRVGQAQSLGSRLTGAAKETAKKVGNYLASKYQAMAERYGPKTAMAMGAAMVVTFPIPGNITVVVGAAEAYRYLAGKFGGGGKGPAPEDEIPAEVVADFRAMLNEAAAAAGVEPPAITDQQIADVLKSHLTHDHRPVGKAVVECGGKGGKPGPCPDPAAADQDVEQAQKAYEKAVDDHKEWPGAKQEQSLKAAKDDLKRKQVIAKASRAETGGMSSEKPVEPAKPASPAEPAKAAISSPAFAPDNKSRTLSSSEMRKRESAVWSTGDHLEDHHRQAIGTYTGNDFTGIQAEIRSGQSGQHAETINNLRDAIAKAPVLDKPVVVYRGMNLKPEEAQQLMADAQQAMQTGKVMERQGFVSTSLDIHNAATFTTQAAPVMYEIAARHGIYVDPHSDRAGEKEFLMDHGSKFRVTGIKEVPVQGGKRRVIQMEQVL